MFDLNELLYKTPVYGKGSNHRIIWIYGYHVAKKIQKRVKVIGVDNHNSYYPQNKSFKV